MQGEEKDFRLPRLNPLIQLHPGPERSDGTPSWTLHHPAANRYFQLGWTEFECVARFHQCETAGELIDRVNAETTLDIDLDDVKHLVIFLHEKGLVSGEDAQTDKTPDDKKDPLWKRAMHGYLFFTFPVFKPQSFLRRSLPYVKPLLSRTFLTVSYTILLIFLFLTLGRLDEFTHTFFQLFTLEGALLTILTFTVIKVFHEFGHAYTATRYGVKIPHMGIALVVLYPILYTETSGAWRLHSRRERMHIGLAGVMTELVIAAYALVIWHISPAGMMQTLAFSVVAISLIGSLFVNLNPLMRFDGYFVLSDYLGVENLHAKGFAFARWWLRKVLFGLNDPQPEDVSAARKRFLIVFGWATLIYRFFLFLGIAWLVYYLFFKPLGLIMMLVELAWFIGIPILSELKIWWERKQDILAQKRARRVFGVTAVMLFVMMVPWHSGFSVPAVMHAAEYRAIYPPVASVIKAIHVREGQAVESGQILVELESDQLETDIALARTELENLLKQKRREQAQRELYQRRRNDIAIEIQAAREKLVSLEKQKQQLVIKAPFDGKIRDITPEIHERRYVPPSELVLRVVDESRQKFTGYVDEAQLKRIKGGQEATFYPDFSLFGRFSAKIDKIEPVNVENLRWAELASVYGGAIPSEFHRAEKGTQSIVPRQSLYSVSFVSDKKSIKKQNVISRGRMKIDGESYSPAMDYMRRFVALVLREISLN